MSGKVLFQKFYFRRFITKDMKIYIVINLAIFFTSTRYIHENAERLLLFQQHKREPVQDF